MVELFDVINPRQTVLITTKGKAKVLGKEVEKENIMPVDWHTPLSLDPPKYGIAINKGSFSLKLIRESKFFIVNFMPFEAKKEAAKLGSVSGEHVEKFEETLLAKAEGETLECPRMHDALAYIECEVEDEVEVGDHILFIGKIMHVRKVKDGKRLFHIKQDEFTTTQD